MKTPRILLTAFGPFNKFIVNPSQLVLENIQVQLGEKNVTYKLLDVSYQDVDKFSQELDEHFSLIIHMGVATDAIKMRLELLARNNVQGLDVLGHELPVLTISDDGQNLLTNFPKKIIDSIAVSYKSAIVLSDDAGSYLCNYIYYKSLQKMETHSHVLFIHIADFVSNPNALRLTDQTLIIITLIQEYLDYSKNTY